MNESLFAYALTVFTGLFAVMNPIANTPIFMGLVEEHDKKSKLRIARLSTIVAFLIVVAFSFLGKFIFDVFGITIPAFKITGGILLFYVGFEMLISHKSRIHNPHEVEMDDSIAISPLAIPILAGPGTIVTAMNLVTEANFIHLSIVIGVFALMIILTYLCFRYSETIVEKLGRNFITVVAKLMGLILAIMGTGMVIEGIMLVI